MCWSSAHTSTAGSPAPWEASRAGWLIRVPLRLRWCRQRRRLNRELPGKADTARVFTKRLPSRRNAIATCLFAALTLLVCAALLIGSVLAHAQVAVLPLVA